MRVLVVAFYTADGDGYEKEIKRLEASIDHFKLESLIMRITPMTWNDAVTWKPQFIRRCLEKCEYHDGVLYVDADAEFVAVPDFHILENCHVGFHRFRRAPHFPEEILTGTLYFANTPLVRDFVEDWVEETKKWRPTDTPEQLAWKKMWPRWKDKLTAFNLPPAWVWIHDTFPQVYGHDNRIVIRHYQASRRLRKRLDKKRS